MKYLKTFENNNLTGEDIIKLISDYANLESSAYNFLLYMMETNKDDPRFFDKKADMVEDVISIGPMNRNFNGKDYVFYIHYITSDDDESYCRLTQEEYNNFIEFVNNPDMFKDIKKYNL